MGGGQFIIIRIRGDEISVSDIPGIYVAIPRKKNPPMYQIPCTTINIPPHIYYYYLYCCVDMFVMRKVHKSRCWKLCVIKRWRRLLSASEGKLKQVMNAFLVMKYKFASDSDSRNCEGYQNGHRTTQKRNSIYVKKKAKKKRGKEWRAIKLCLS